MTDEGSNNLTHSDVETLLAKVHEFEEREELLKEVFERREEQLKEAFEEREEKIKDEIDEFKDVTLGDIEALFLRQSKVLQDQIREEFEEREEKLKEEFEGKEEKLKEEFEERIALLENQSRSGEVAKGMLLEDDDYYDDDGKAMIQEDYELPESVFSLLIVAPVLSLTFLYSWVVICFSVACLAFAMVDLLQQGEEGNVFGLPVDVSSTVKGAQFLGIFVALLYEDEIRTGLELLVVCCDSSFLLDHSESFRYKRIIVSSILRILVGLLFLSCVFVAVLQSDSVLSVFYDVLALEFVENIDDAAYLVAKRGFFGTTLQAATIVPHTLQRLTNRGSFIDPLQSLRASSKSRASLCARVIYTLIAATFVAALAVASSYQATGVFRCEEFIVTFNEEIWEDANVVVDGQPNTQLLLYSFFNGVYRENGTHHGYPKYTEHNKREGVKYNKTIGAEIKYCKSIKAWIFTHENIKSSLDKETENECNWLARSPETKEYDLSSVVGSDWSFWVGEVKENSGFIASCTHCSNEKDCNFRGKCNQGTCECEQGFVGAQCGTNYPCQDLSAGVQVEYNSILHTLKIPSDSNYDYGRVYDRPIYFGENVNVENLVIGNTAASEGLVFQDDDTVSYFTNKFPIVVVAYFGSRWVATVRIPGEYSADDLFPPEYHEFWTPSVYDETYSFLMSEVTSENVPVGIEFLQFRRRYKADIFSYGPFGVLRDPFPDGTSGLFTCGDEFPSYSPTRAPFVLPNHKNSVSLSPVNLSSSRQSPSNNTPSLNRSSLAPSLSSSQTSSNCFFIEVDITVGDPPAETGWALSKIDSRGVTLIDSMYSTDSATPNEHLVKTLCATPGNYRFFFYNKGNNTYVIRTRTTIIEQGASETVEFNFPF